MIKMKEYRIGILEDKSSERDNIKRTIDFNKNKETSVVFVDYDIFCDNQKYNEFKDKNKIIDEIENDVIDEKISLLIIDNKLINNEFKIAGTGVYKKIKDLISNFPIIIMTNYKEEVFKENVIDSDKVYDKGMFFKNGDYTKEKVNSIFLSIDRFLKNKDSIISNKEELILKYETGTGEDEMSAIIDLLKVEEEEKKYTPVDTSYLEELISPNKIKEIIEYLNEIQSKIE